MIMKSNYIKPQTRVIAAAYEHHLLTGSAEYLASFTQPTDNVTSSDEMTGPVDLGSKAYINGVIDTAIDKMFTSVGL